MKKFIKKNLFVLFLVAIYMMLSIIPVPFVDVSKIKGAALPAFLSYMSIYSGGAISHFTLMATGITSYIFATMIMQLLIFLNSGLYQFSKTPYGNKQIKKYIMVIGVFASMIFSVFITRSMNSAFNFLTNTKISSYLIIAVFHGFGTFLAIEIAEEITRYGHYEGMAVLLLVNVLQQMPSSLQLISQNVTMGAVSLRHMEIFTAAAIVLSLIFVSLCTGEYRIPIQTNFPELDLSFPVRLDASGTTAIIFSESIVQLIYFIAQNTKSSILMTLTKPMTPYSILITSILLFGFVFFYSFVYFNVTEISEYMKVSEQRFLHQPNDLSTPKYFWLCIRHINFFSATVFTLTYAAFQIVCMRCSIPYISYIVIFLIVSSSVSLGNQFSERFKFYSKSV